VTKREHMVGMLVMIIVILLVSVFISCYQRSDSGGITAWTKNRLTNTTWQANVYNGTRNLYFGENSFREGLDEGEGDLSGITTGTYTISGDAVVLEYSSAWDGSSQQSTGSLIGDTLAIFSNEYKRVK
jgi:hypothetical protein